MYDDVAKLISYGESTFDQYGNEMVLRTETEIFVQPRGVYQSEYYNAAQLGLKPSITFVIANRADYDGQKEVEFEERLYSVIRADWNAQRDTLSLICEEKANG